MGRTAMIVLWVVAMAAVIVALDVLFFRHHFWLRFIVNVGVVSVFAVIYFGFRKRL
jgi:hypothetical protein